MTYIDKRWFCFERPLRPESTITVCHLVARFQKQLLKRTKISFTLPSRLTALWRVAVIGGIGWTLQRDLLSHAPMMTCSTVLHCLVNSLSACCPMLRIPRDFRP